MICTASWLGAVTPWRLVVTVYLLLIASGRWHSTHHKLSQITLTTSSYHKWALDRARQQHFNQWMVEKCMCNHRIRNIQTQDGPLPLCSHQWGRGWTLAGWHHPLQHIHPYYLEPPSSLPPSLSSCLFRSTLHSIGKPTLTLEVEPSQYTSYSRPTHPCHKNKIIIIKKIYSSTGSSFSNMLWHCFSFTSLHFLTTPSVGLLPLPQDCESTMVRGKAPLDPPYLPPSGQGGLSQPEAAQWEEREGET